MEFGLKVLVLVMAFAFNFVLGDEGAVYFDCPANTYVNNDKYIELLQNVLFTQYSTAPLGDNEMFLCVKKAGYIFCKTTVDNQCCRSFNVTLKAANFQPTDETAEYFSYEIKTAPTGCTVVVDEFADMKILSYKVEFSKYCFMLWTCRKSRQGVHAFCNSQTISDNLRKWIVEEYKRIDSTLAPQIVNQNKDYRNGVCFRKQFVF